MALVVVMGSCVSVAYTPRRPPSLATRASPPSLACPNPHTQVLTKQPSPVYGCLMFPCVAKGSRYYEEEGVESNLLKVRVWHQVCNLGGVHGRLECVFQSEAQPMPSAGQLLGNAALRSLAPRPPSHAATSHLAGMGSRASGRGHRASDTCFLWSNGSCLYSTALCTSCPSTGRLPQRLLCGLLLQW